MAAGGVGDREDEDGERVVVEVTVTEQQAVLFELLRPEGPFGTTDGEIVRHVFQEFVRQEGW